METKRILFLLMLTEDSEPTYEEWKQCSDFALPILTTNHSEPTYEEWKLRNSDELGRRSLYSEPTYEEWKLSTCINFSFDD